MDEVEHYMDIHRLEDAALSVFVNSQWSKPSLPVFMAHNSSNTMMRGLSPILPRRLTVPFAAILPIDHIHTIAPGFALQSRRRDVTVVSSGLLLGPAARLPAIYSFVCPAPFPLQNMQKGVRHLSRPLTQIVSNPEFTCRTGYDLSKLR